MKSRQCVLLLLLIGLASRVWGRSDEVLSIHGSGSTFTVFYVRKIGSILRDRSRIPLEIGFRSTNGTAGRVDYLGTGTANTRTDFLIAEAPLEPSNMDLMRTQGREPYQFMIGSRTLAFVANIQGYDGQVMLSACDLALIYSGVITNWTDSRLTWHASLTPAVLDTVFPDVIGSQIRVVMRKGITSSFRGVGQYLTNRCNASWAFSGKEDTSLLAAKIPTIIYSSSDVDTIKRTWETRNALAWVDLADLEAGTPMKLVGMQAWDGSWIYPGSSASTTTGPLSSQTMAVLFNDSRWPSSVQGDFTNVPFNGFSPSAATIAANVSLPPAAWPLVLPSFLIIDSGLWNTEEGSLARAMVEFMLGAEGQSVALTLGLGGQPAALLSWQRAQLLARFNATNLLYVFYFEASANKEDLHSISNVRSTFDYTELLALRADVTTLKKQVAQALPLVLDGSGSAVSQKFISKMMSTVQDRLKVPAQLGFRRVGTDIAIQEFVGADQGYEPYTHFGVGEDPIPKATWAAMKAAGRSILHLPVAINGVLIAHNVPGIDASTGPLNLTACLLTRIFQRSIFSWNVEQVFELNPSFRSYVVRNPKLDYRILLSFRAPGSSTTLALTDYLQHATNGSCPGLFTMGVSTKPTFPTGDGTRFFDSETDMVDYIGATSMSLGYMAFNSAKNTRVAVSQLQSKEGTWLYPWTSDLTLALGNITNAFPQDFRDDFSGCDFNYADGTDTWPIVSVSYMYLRVNLTSFDDSGPLLESFVKVVFSAEGQQVLEDGGYTPLPTYWTEKSAEALEFIITSIKSPQFTYETTTLPEIGSGSRVLSTKRESATTAALNDLKTTLMQSDQDAQALIETLLKRIEVLEGLSRSDTRARTLGAVGSALGAASLFFILMHFAFHCLGIWVMDRSVRELDMESRSSYGKGLKSVDGDSSKLSANNSKRNRVYAS